MNLKNCKLTVFKIDGYIFALSSIRGMFSEAWSITEQANFSRIKTGTGIFSNIKKITKDFLTQLQKICLCSRIRLSLPCLFSIIHWFATFTVKNPLWAERTNSLTLPFVNIFDLFALYLTFSSWWIKVSYLFFPVVARIMEYASTPWMSTLFHPSQNCLYIYSFSAYT